MNHAAFYDGMKKTAEIMLKLQKNRGITAAAEYLKDLKHNSEFADIDAEDENDKAFYKDFLLTIDYLSDSDAIVHHCFNKLIGYLDDITLKKKFKEEFAKTKTSHEEMIKLAKDIRGTLVMFRDTNTSDDLIAVNAFTIINKLTSKLPVEDDNDDRFIKQMVDIARNYSGQEMVYNMIATIDKWHMFKVEESSKKEEKENREFCNFMRDLQHNLSGDIHEYWTELTEGSSLYLIVKELSKSCNEYDARFAKRIINVLEDQKPTSIEKAQSLKIILYLYFDGSGGRIQEPEEEESETMNVDPVIPIDELSKKIANKKKMDKENVGYTILCEMKNLVEQTTTKLTDNIEEEDFSSTLDKRLINRDLQSLLNSYSNILEVLGQYYVKLEK